MSSPGSSQPWKRERRSCFFKLIDSFAVEIGTLKKEMVRKRKPPAARGHDDAHAPFGLGEEVGGLFLQAGPPAGMTAAPAGVRDSGYDSLRRRLSILDRLMQTHGVWLQLGLSHQEATHVLQGQPTGTFVVRRSASLQKKVISVRMEQNSTPAVRDFPVRENQYAFSLDGSGLSFADLFRLVAFCCISRDVLPFTLKLPQAIAAARTSADLEHIGKLGSDFWNQSEAPVRSEGSGAAEVSPASAAEETEDLKLVRCWLKVRSPSQLDCCRSNGALCFINPLFLKVHSDCLLQGGGSCSAESSQQEDLSSETSSSCSSSSCSQKPGGAETGPRPRPPRQPPPRFGARLQPTPLVTPPPTPRQRSSSSSMPEKIPWVRTGPRLGSSPTSRFSLTSPISIPLPSLPSLSCSPRRSKTVLACSQEDDQCHLALQDNTIEQALLRAKLHQNSARRGSDPTPDPAQASSACSSSLPQAPPPDTLGQKGGVATEGEDEGDGGGGGRGQRLSDMSFSTGSSDSLDFSQSSAFFLPPLYDPSPPTEAELDRHLPVIHPYSSMEEEEDDEDQDYGVSLDSDQDQDQDLTMVPPGRRRRRSSAVVLPTALQRHIRKMSGVFHTLLTPEKRAVRRVVELSRSRASYFGSLVQDYVAYMGEGGGATLLGSASGPELLQTLRQFITQMKSYLRQSSELQPPIDSLIPEDQIDRVLEKAMLKCVMKPLRPAVSAALQEFQVRSGEWQELKDNLALAKARQPQDMGVSETLGPPPPVAIEKMRHKFQAMVKHYSPEKKVALLLSVCKLIYSFMEDNTGRPYGADDFLPMLTYVLAQCDMPQLDNEILYMMELLDPTLLQGEGGYYLTSAYGAMTLLRHFREDQAAEVLSSQTRNTLHQWHRRRTDTLRAAPSINDFQCYLRVALKELDSGCTAKTLKVAPHTTAEEVCQLCAIKFKVSEPEAYALFLVMEDSSQQLAPDTHPQKIKAELHSSAQADHFHFVYRRLVAGQASLESTSALPNLNQLAENLVLEQNLSLNLGPDRSLVPDRNLDLGLTEKLGQNLDQSLGLTESLGLDRSLVLDQNLGPTLRLSLPPAHLDNTLLSV